MISQRTHMNNLLVFRKDDCATPFPRRNTYTQKIKNNITLIMDRQTHTKTALLTKRQMKQN